MKKLVDCVSCPVALPEEEARKVDELCKNLPSGLSYRTKAFEVEYQFEVGERAEISVLTSKSVDKSGEVVLPEGLELDSYRKSGVVLWNHNKERPPIATCTWIKLYHDAVRGKTTYPEKPPDYEGEWFTDEVWALTRCVPPILKSKSIGFLPLTPLRDPTSEELNIHPDWQGAGIWEKSMLLEYSCVYNGCNDSALVEVINTKSLDTEILKHMGITVPDPVIEIKTPEVIIQPKLSLERYKADDCVSNKIKHMHDSGEGSKYSDSQIIAIAYSMCHAKAAKKKTKKSIDMNAVINKASESIDVKNIVERAVLDYKNRFKV